MKFKKNIKEYQSVSATVQIDQNDKHKIVQLLLEGATLHITQAMLALDSKNIANKGEHISMAITIVDALNASLNIKDGGEIANNLHNLYEYIMTQLVTANINDDQVKLDEIKKLLLTIKEGWDGIREEVSQLKSDNVNDSLDAAS